MITWYLTESTFIFFAIECGITSSAIRHECVVCYSVLMYEKRYNVHSQGKYRYLRSYFNTLSQYMKGEEGRNVQGKKVKA